jgi:MerR family transcriptional regulator, repressor of the yfmOP operon
MTAGTAERGYRIGEVAERVGITARTIRYYEELGLLGTLADRSKGRHRLYSEADVRRLAELLRLRDLLGLSLEELTALAETGQERAVLRDRWADTESDEERARIVEAAIPLVERQLELVRARRGKLDEFADELSEKLGSLRREERRLGRVPADRPVAP